MGISSLIENADVTIRSTCGFIRTYIMTKMRPLTPLPQQGKRRNRNETYISACVPPGPYNNVQIPQEEDFKYLGPHLDRRLPGTNTFSQNGNNEESTSPKCTGYSDESQNSLQATNFSYIKQYSNQSGLKEYNSGVRVPLPT
jgi:hypothetical protein